MFQSIVVCYWINVKRSSVNCLGRRVCAVCLCVFRVWISIHLSYFHQFFHAVKFAIRHIYIYVCCVSWNWCTHIAHLSGPPGTISTNILLFIWTVCCSTVALFADQFCRRTYIHFHFILKRSIFHIKTSSFAVVLHIIRLFSSIFDFAFHFQICIVASVQCCTVHMTQNYYCARSLNSQSVFSNS